MGLKSTKIFTALIVFLGLIFSPFFASSVNAQTQNNWFMAGGNAKRTSWITDDVSGVSGITWYRPIEAYIDQKVQIVTGNRNIYVATSKGLVVLDAENGSLKWRFDTDLPIGNSPTVIGSTVYFTTYGGKVYSLSDNGSNYSVNWTFEGSKLGFSVNPLVYDNKVFVGGRDGYFYALNSSNGSISWQYPQSNQTSIGPILVSAAYDNGVVYFAAGDQYAYALNSSNGSLVWKSANKLPGERPQAWWPVIFDDRVIFAITMAYKNEFNPGTHSVLPGANMKEIFRDTFLGTATGNSGDSLTSSGSQGWPSGLSLLDTQSNSSAVTNTLSGYFSQRPQMRSHIALNKSNGTDSDTIPFLYAGTYSGTVYPMIINPNTNAAYAKNLISGTGGSGIARGKFMGWKPGNRYLHQAENATWAIDEPQGYAGAGTHAYFVLCCDRAGGTVSGTTWWNYGGTMLEQQLPSQGEPNSYDPMWRKYGNALERLQSYYKGALDSRNGVYQSHGLQNPLIPYRFTNSQGQTVNRLFSHRSNTIIALGTNSSQTFISSVNVNSNPQNTSKTRSTSDLQTILNNEIDKIIDVYDANPQNGFLAPGYYNDGTPVSFFTEYYFINPGDGLLALSRAYNQVSDGGLRSRLSTYLQNYYNKYFSSTPITRLGWTNQKRENIAYPPEVVSSMAQIGDSTNGPFAMRNFYAFAKYAEIFTSQALSIYNAHRSRLVVPSNLSDDTLLRYPYTFNDYIAGYYGFLRLQELAGRAQADSALRTQVQNDLNSLLTRRTQGFQKDHPWLGENDNPSGIQINTYVRQFNTSRNFLYLTKELGDYMRQNNGSVIGGAVNEYTYLSPFWFSTNNNNAFQEGVQHNLWEREALFSAKAWVQGAGQSELSKYIDAPTFDRGDYFYINNLVTALEAGGGSPTIEPTPAPLPGDANRDGVVNIQDYQALSLSFGKTPGQTGYNPNADFNSDNVVNIQDYQILSTNFGRTS